MPSAPCLDGGAAHSPAAVGMSSWSRSPNSLQKHSNGLPEQVFRVLKPSKKAIKAFPLSGSYQNPCRAIWFGPEAQAAKLETWHLFQDTQTAGVHVGALSGHHIDQNYCASMIQSASVREVEASQGSNVLSVVSNDARAENDRENTMQSYTDNQLVGIQDHHMSFNHGDDGYTYSSQGAMAARSYTDGQMSGSTGGTTGTLSGVDKRFEDGYGSEEALNPHMIGMDNKESTNASSKVVPLRAPTYRTPTYLQDSSHDSVCYLTSLRVDCVKIFQIEPTLKSCTLEQIKAVVLALEGYGVNCKDIARIFNVCPKVLLLDVEKDLKIVTSFLFNEVGIPPQDFGKALRRRPRLLIMDINTHLRPTLSFLRSLGFAKLGHIIANNPSLLSFGVESRLLPRLRLLESWGFTYREAAAMVVRFPAIFNYSAVENLQCKYDYLIHEIKAGNKDLLAFPQYFGYSLEWRIRPRHQRLAKLNVPLSIVEMLSLSDLDFHDKFSIVDGASILREKDEFNDSLYKPTEAKLHDFEQAAAPVFKL